MVSAVEDGTIRIELWHIITILPFDFSFACISNSYQHLHQNLTKSISEVGNVIFLMERNYLVLSGWLLHLHLISKLTTMFNNKDTIYFDYKQHFLDKVFSTSKLTVHKSYFHADCLHLLVEILSKIYSNFSNARKWKRHANKQSVEWKMQIFMNIYHVYIWTIDDCTLFNASILLNFEKLYTKESHHGCACCLFGCW